MNLISQDHRKLEDNLPPQRFDCNIGLALPWDKPANQQANKEDRQSSNDNSQVAVKSGAKVFWKTGRTHPEYDEHANGNGGRSGSILSLLHDEAEEEKSEDAAREN